MPALAPLLISPAEARVWRWGLAALGAAGAGALALTLVLVAEEPLYGFAPAALALACAGLFALSRYPLGHLCAVLVLFGFTAKYKEGFQVEELAFALYYAGYLVHWYTTRLFFRRERLVRTVADGAIVFFLVYVVGSLFLTILFRGVPADALSELVNFSMLAFYFPIREACERHERGPAVMAGVILFLGAYVFVQNLLIIQAAIADAQQAWQIARGRVAMNEILLLVPAIWTATFAVRARSKKARAILAAGFAMFTVGVLLTQWRSYYIDLAFGLVLLAFAFRGHERRRLLSFVLTGLVGIVVIGYALFADTMMLIALGLADRILSIGTATSADVSLINRWFETQAVWELIKANPIAGYGLGVHFGYFDAISSATSVKPFVHNGYLMLWFKFGLFGLLAILALWFRSIAGAVRCAYDATRPLVDRTYALFCAITLTALIPSHATMATFTTSDTVVAFAILTGLAAGLERRGGIVGPVVTASPRST